MNLSVQGSSSIIGTACHDPKVRIPQDLPFLRHLHTAYGTSPPSGQRHIYRVTSMKPPQSPDVDDRMTVVPSALYPLPSLVMQIETQSHDYAPNEAR